MSLTLEEIEYITDAVVARVKQRYYLIEKTYNFDPASRLFGNEEESAKIDYFFDNIVKHVCEHFEIDKKLLLSKTRNDKEKNQSLLTVSEMRFIIMGMCRDLPENPISYGRIGAMINKDHSSVIAGEKRCIDLRRFNPVFAAQYRKIEHKVNESMRIK